MSEVNLDEIMDLQATDFGGWIISSTFKCAIFGEKHTETGVLRRGKGPRCVGRGLIIHVHPHTEFRPRQNQNSRVPGVAS